MSRYAKIIGTGSYLPKKVLSNFDLEKMVDTSSEWIVTRTGIKERHIAGKGETPATMAEEAACKALKAAKMKAENIEMIIVSTCTPEKFLPSTACMIQKQLNVGQAFAFDISAACSGFVYAMDIANQYICSGKVNNALIVGSEILTAATNWEDRNTCVLFGDGAGAVILESSDEPGIIDSKLYSDGNFGDLLYLNTGLYDNAGLITMYGREIFKVAAKAMVQAVEKLLITHNLRVDDIDWLIPHQANYRIITMVADRLNLPKEKVILTVSEHANTSSASIPLAFDGAIRAGKIKRGQIVVFTAFGGGLTWGANLFKF